LSIVIDYESGIAAGVCKNDLEGIMDIQIGRLLLDFEFKTMSSYLDLVHQWFEQYAEKIENSYDNAISLPKTEDEITYFEDYYTDKFIEATHTFPQLLLLSFISTWYAFTEQKLLELCKRLNIDAQSIDKRDKGVTRSKKLLEVHGYSFDTDHWNKLRSINKLRNTIIHEGKKFKCSHSPSENYKTKYQADGEQTIYIAIDKVLFDYLLQHNMIFISGITCEIMPTFEYCRDLISFGREMFRKLYSELHIK